MITMDITINIIIIMKSTWFHDFYKTVLGGSSSKKQLTSLILVSLYSFQKSVPVKLAYLNYLKRNSENLQSGESF